MKPARTSKRHFENTKLLVINPSLNRGLAHTTLEHLTEYLKPGDLIVVNRSGTMPSSFTGSIARTLERLELRLASFRGKDAQSFQHWRALSFGSGNWQVPTEKRGSAPVLQTGDCIEIGPDLKAHVLEVDPKFPRLLEIRFESQKLLQRLFELGKPIQYSYLQEELQVWDQQTALASNPISVEPPSSAFALNWDQLFKIQKAGVVIAPLLHAAGISSSGDVMLDAQFPLAEYFEIPEQTLELVLKTKKSGGKVIALGTTVARALESAFQNPQNLKTKGYTTLKLGPESKLYATDGILTGMHEEGTSHAELMKAYCGCELLKTAEQEAHHRKYRSHEYGDLTLVDCSKIK